MTLDELGLKYGTDKASSFHNYLATYERYLEPMRNRMHRILEIGIAGGGSLRMWRDFFPAVQVVGIDHNAAFVEAAKEQERIVAVLGEATSKTFWEIFEGAWGREAFDFICDDGGHFANQIIGGFEGAWPLLRKGGLYAIEDVHAIYQYDDPVKFFGWLEGLLHRHVNEHGTNQCGRPTTGDIEYIHFYKSLIILRKRIAI